MMKNSPDSIPGHGYLENQEISEEGKQNQAENKLGFFSEARNLEARAEEITEGGSETAGREAIASGEEMKSATEHQVAGEANSPKGCKLGEVLKGRYSRSELEALRLVDVEEQQRRWDSIYQGLGVVVAGEFDQMAAEKHHKLAHKSTDRRKNSGKRKHTAANSGVVCFQSVGTIFDEVKSMDLTCGVLADRKENSTIVEEVCYEDDDSDDECDSIQRPAFVVEGEPDFESGPPQDGLEYLRRVRWEAAQCPKVKVVKLDRNKLKSEQTPYMPNIPEIAKCPVHLLPSKHWQEVFLADFSDLRQVLAQLENSSDEYLRKLPPISSDGSSKTRGNQEVLKNIPTVSAILGMDAVSRASMLRARIDSLETADTVSRVDCLWLFALCAAVDIPLNAEMGASLRCLLRKCASLRAQKSDTDDEVVMLNVLVTIAGSYFGQSDVCS
eukprot:TRINITY_DN5265_c0_g1_i1.p1 TRINITY_DN5265_c0_g1~~TRINITY_DN5265_c0_g1_i1.p1  ORF type:complete len:441 (-),score=100.77 TRINITY_DN5265_c0_g1_i1:178-1500(-)